MQAYYIQNLLRIKDDDLKVKRVKTNKNIMEVLIHLT